MLNEVSLTIFHGDTVAIMGASGAGKSTLLQIIGTLDTPDAGTYLFEGQDVLAMSQKNQADFRNRHIGFVFQFHHLLPEFTALENVMMPGLIGRMKRPEAERQASELLEQVGLADRLQHQPGELSGGEQQRVAIARALFMKPKILLADEPTGNLDLKTSAEIHKVLQDLNLQMNITLVIVTHNPELASQMRVQLLVDSGKIIPFHQGDDRLEGRIDPALMNHLPASGLPFDAGRVDKA